MPGMAKLLRRPRSQFCRPGEEQKPRIGVSAPHDHGLMSPLESGLKPNKKALFRGRSFIIARGVLGREISYAAFACAMRRYFLTAFSMPGPAFFRSSRFIAGWNSICALKARNHGSATAGIWEVSFRSKKMKPVLLPFSSAK